MDWQHTLIRIYLFVCRRYRGRLKAVAQRQSNNRKPDFTDEEVLKPEQSFGVYLFGIIRKRKTIQEIYDYTADHFPGWFPGLPSYGGYVQRLNRLSAVFAPLVESALEEIDGSEAAKEAARIADSMPIMMAGEKRSSQASVAPEFANKGYCSSKGTFFYGVKLHVVGERRRGSVPLPEYVGMTPGSENDLVALRRVLPEIKGRQLYGDKAYSDGPMKERLAEDQDLDLLTPVKKKKGQEHLAAADKLFSEGVSRVRQPIESLFNWIDDKTGIQCASKVRSYQGLLVHVFGRLAAAMLLLAFNP